MENEPPHTVFLIPYRDRVKEAKYFMAYFEHYVKKQPNMDSGAIFFFCHQSDTRPFNRGAMKNLGFLMIGEINKQLNSKVSAQKIKKKTEVEKLKIENERRFRIVQETENASITAEEEALKSIQKRYEGVLASELALQKNIPVQPDIEAMRR